MLFTNNVLFSALLSLPFLTSSAVAAGAAKCQQNACLSAVQKGRDKGGPGGCNKFLEKTIVAKPTTTTVYTTSTITKTSFSSTGTVTITTTANVAPGKRNVQAKPQPTIVSQTTIPKYAATCGNTDQYSSACSCIGVQQKTVTSTPTLTLTSTRLTRSTTVTDTLTTVFTTTASCSLAVPTQIVLNPGFEDGSDPDDAAQPLEWTFSPGLTTFSEPSIAFEGDTCGLYTPSNYENALASQTLAVPANVIGRPLRYDFSLAVGQSKYDFVYQVRVLLDDQEIVPQQGFCLPEAPCQPNNPTNDFYRWRTITASGSVESLDENSSLKIELFGDTDDFTSSGLFDAVALRLSCPPTE